VLFSFVKGVKASYLIQPLDEEWKTPPRDFYLLCPYLCHLRTLVTEKKTLRIWNALQKKNPKLLETANTMQTRPTGRIRERDLSDTIIWKLQFGYSQAQATQTSHTVTLCDLVNHTATLIIIEVSPLHFKNRKPKLKINIILLRIK